MNIENFNRYINSLTWEELANEINDMPIEERSKKIKVVAGGDYSVTDREVAFCKIGKEALCYDKNIPFIMCEPKSEFDGDKEADVKVAIESGEYCLFV